MQVQLTQEAKIASDFFFIRAIFAVVGFVSALSAPSVSCGRGAVYAIGGGVDAIAPRRRGERMDRDGFCRVLLAWYDREKRELPWRGTQDPYRVWLSEIMLQQTRAEAVAPRYEAFLTRFPTVAALAAADEEAVLKAWEGMGYYSRARNLRRAAMEVARRGEFPQSADRIVYRLTDDKGMRWPPVPAAPPFLVMM